MRQERSLVEVERHQYLCVVLLGIHHQQSEGLERSTVLLDEAADLALGEDLVDILALRELASNILLGVEALLGERGGRVFEELRPAG